MSFESAAERRQTAKCGTLLTLAKSINGDLRVPRQASEIERIVSAEFT